MNDLKDTYVHIQCIPISLWCVSPIRTRTYIHTYVCTLCIHPHVYTYAHVLSVQFPFYRDSCRPMSVAYTRQMDAFDWTPHWVTSPKWSGAGVTSASYSMATTIETVRTGLLKWYTCVCVLNSVGWCPEFLHTILVCCEYCNFHNYRIQWKLVKTNYKGPTKSVLVIRCSYQDLLDM